MNRLNLFFRFLVDEFRFDLRGDFCCDFVTLGCKSSATAIRSFRALSFFIGCNITIFRSGIRFDNSLLSNSDRVFFSHGSDVTTSLLKIEMQLARVIAKAMILVLKSFMVLRWYSAGFKYYRSKWFNQLVWMI